MGRGLLLYLIAPRFRIISLIGLLGGPHEESRAHAWPVPSGILQMKKSPADEPG
jgi:hypothetical protein